MAAWAQILSMVGSKALDWGLDHYENVRQQHFEHDEAALNRDWQSNEAETSRQWQENMWNKENAYNTPSAQMARLNDAGINPYLSQSSVGSGGNQAVPSASIPVGSKASAPVMQSSHRFGDLGDFLLRKTSVDAQNSNQRAQAFKTAVEAASELWKVSPSLAKNYLRTAALQYGQDNEAFDRFEQEFRLDMERKESENERLRLENALTKDFGAKKAKADLDRVDQWISESIAKIGKMASDSQLNDSEIAKNKRICEELGSQIARNMAEAGLFSANATTVNDLRAWVVSSAHSKAKVDYYNKEEVKSAFRAGTKRRAWMESIDSQDRNLWNYQMSPEGNYVTSLLNGFTKNVSPLIPSTSQKNVDVNYHLP